MTIFDNERIYSHASVAVMRGVRYYKSAPVWIQKFDSTTNGPICEMGRF